MVVDDEQSIQEFLSLLLDWTAKLSHCFLIRDPFEVVASYAQKRDSITVDDIGIVRQFELFEQISHITGASIPVLDAASTLRDPERTLSGLCSTLGIAFDTAMLQWPAGRRASDGVWAPHWYQAVEASTGFAPYRPRHPDLTDAQRAVAEASLPFYERMLAHCVA